MTKTFPGKDSCPWSAFIRQIIGLLFVLFSFGFSHEAFAADTDLEKGFAAAQKERWDQAVDYFGKAFEANPYNPIVQFNFGLAQEKAGNELVAIALLNTYLAAVPEAANRDQVELPEQSVLAQRRDSDYYPELTHLAKKFGSFTGLMKI